MVTEFNQTTTNLKIAAELKPLMYPRFPALTSAVYRDPDQPGLLVGNPESLHRDKDLLWLDRSLLPAGAMGRSLVLQVSARNHVWTSLGLGPGPVGRDGGTGGREAGAPAGKDWPEMTRGAASLARGLLYRYAGTGAGLPADYFTLRVRARPPSAAGVLGEPSGWFNPLCLHFTEESAAGVRSQEARDFCRSFLEPTALLDVLPEFAAEAGPRVGWHGGFVRARRPVGTVLERLLVSRDWSVPEVPFLMLDCLGGRFEVGAYGTGRPPAIGWRQKRDLDWGFDWLARWCLARLPDLCEAHDRERAVLAKPAFAERLDLYPLAWDDADAAAGEGATYRSRVDGRWAGLLPRSAVVARLPEAPECLSATERSEWNEFVEAWVLDLCRTPLYGEKNWLETLRAEAGGPQAGEIWDVDEAGWWYPYYWGLLRGPADFKVSWQRSHAGRLGEQELGRFMLGKAGPRRRSIVEFELA